jgi:hypothetical protein
MGRLAYVGIRSVTLQSELTCSASLRIHRVTDHHPPPPEQHISFEHRDLHWGNVLVAPTDAEYIEYAVHGTEYRVPTNGVRASIIDFTLSRLETGAGLVYCTDICYPGVWNSFCPPKDYVWTQQTNDGPICSAQMP